MPNLEAHKLVEDAFTHWWENEGSAMNPLPHEDAEEHVRRISFIAWSNGAFKMQEAYKDYLNFTGGS